MTSHEHQTAPKNIYLSIPRNVILSLAVAALVGAAISLIGGLLYSGGMHRVLLAYLVAFAFVLSLSLGGLFFVLLQHLMRAGWGVLVRRPAEVFGLNIITVAGLSLPIVLSVISGSGNLYPWAGHSDVADAHHAGDTKHATPVVLAAEEVAHSHSQEVTESVHADSMASEHLYVHQSIDELTRSKQGWLNPLFFTIRGVLYFSIWIAIAWFYFSRSRDQDSTGGETNARSMEWWSGPCTFAFGITLTFAAIDFLMSLDPHWYSTIFGVYYFAGCAVGGFSLILASILWMERLGVMPGVLSGEHHRDLGRLLFAFGFFRVLYRIQPVHVVVVRECSRNNTLAGRPRGLAGRGLPQQLGHPASYLFAGPLHRSVFRHHVPTREE